MPMLPTVPHQLVLFSKPGCHLCEGLQEKLEAIQQSVPCPLNFKLDIRDITTRTDWLEAYQYEIPVLYWLVPDSDQQDASTSSIESISNQPDSSATMVPIPRPSPRASVANVLRILQASCQS
ncbi:MAG: glutaredoxin family protein [Cyanobacteria bacterium P01_F01_bin.150]